MDNGCRHWGRLCTTSAAQNGPALYARRKDTIESIARGSPSPESGALEEASGTTAVTSGDTGFELVQSNGGHLSGESVPMKPVDPNAKGLIPIVVICYNRAHYLRRTLTSIQRHLGNYANQFPVYVSRQGSHPGVGQVLEEFSNMIRGINRYEFHDTSKRIKGFEGPQWLSYYKISQHYHSALKWLFNTQGMPRVLVLEDDLEISVDFFEYFAALAPVYDTDVSTFSVSGWNDNGMNKVVKDNTNLLRTDVFPGLGWMLNRRIWSELSTKWPLAFWDDWMREPEQSKGRSSIIPEVNRVYTFGDKGNSVDHSFWQNYLAPIRLNDQFVKFREQDLKYIQMPNYEKHLADQIRSAPKIGIEAIATSASDTRVVTYSNEPEFQRAARALGIQPEFKKGNPRSSFGHVNVAYASGRKTFIVDKRSLAKIETGATDWPYLYAGTEIVK